MSPSYGTRSTQTRASQIDTGSQGMKAFSLFLLLLLITGCAPQPSHGTETAALSGHIARVQENLSRVDGKAAVIEQWLRSH